MKTESIDTFMFPWGENGGICFSTTFLYRWVGCYGWRWPI